MPTTLVYKRTHHGDPDIDGLFGIYDCMGRVRATEYGAVIGVGGTGPEPIRHGIAGKITWIGIGPTKLPGVVLKSGKPPRGPLVLFEHFLYLGENGPAFSRHAPKLADHVYGNRVRWMNRFTEAEHREIDAILEMARDAPPSPAMKHRASSSRKGRRC